MASILCIQFFFRHFFDTDGASKCSVPFTKHHFINVRTKTANRDMMVKDELKVNVIYVNVIVH